jgi:hypothetical protein
VTKTPRPTPTAIGIRVLRMIKPPISYNEL